MGLPSLPTVDGSIVTFTGNPIRTSTEYCISARVGNLVGRFRTRSKHWYREIDRILNETGTLSGVKVKYRVSSHVEILSNPNRKLPGF